jgi:iron complex outermembrane recepter protein
VRFVIMAAVCCAVSAFSATPAAAQVAVTVQGVVRDGAGRPLEQAQVLLLPGGQQTVTDAAGRFRLRLPGAGEYRLHVSLIGYAPVQRVVRGGAAEPDLEVRLATTPLTLGGIEVTASPTARAPASVTQSTAQLSGRALERELGGTVAQTLRYQPGVAVRFNGPAAALPVLRGLTGDRVLMLQDGQRTADLAGSADDHAVTVDPLTAQRVEVVRGPATLLYGNNALGGVVNVISGDISGSAPLRPQLAVVAQTETAYPGGAVSARGVVPVGDDWSVMARAGARSAGDMRTGPDPVLGGRLRNTSSRSANGALAVTRSGAAWTGSAALRAYDFAYGLPTPPGSDPVDLRGERLELAVRAEAALGSERVPAATVDGTWQRYAHDELDDTGSVDQRFELGTQTFGVRVRQARLGPFREGAWGASLLQKSYAATGPAALTPAADSRAVGVFGFQEIGLGAAALQMGARADRYSVSSHSSVKFGDGVDRVFAALSGSVGLSVPLATGLGMTLTASRSFRAPTVEELFSGAAHAGTGSVEFGDPSLRAERGRAAELLLRLGTARLNGQAAAFINRVSDYVQLVHVGDTLIGGTAMPVHRFSQAQATLRGVEGSLEVALGPSLLLAGRADWLHTRQASGAPLSFMPPARAGLTLRWDNGRFALGGDAHHELAQRRTGPADETATDAHTILRVDAAARVRVLGRMHALSLRVDNLTNELHREATSRIKDFAPAAGRNIAVIYRVSL